jgi:hypothetical protein
MITTDNDSEIMFAIVVVVYFTVILFQYPAELHNIIVHKGSIGGAPSCHVRIQLMF